ncbi:MAG: transposase [bacterium]
MLNNKPHQKNLRQERYVETGFYYFITTNTKNREKIFLHRAAAMIVLDALQWLNDRDRITLIAAVVMPDHLHFVAELKANQSQQDARPAQTNPIQSPVGVPFRCDDGRARDGAPTMGRAVQLPRFGQTDSPVGAPSRCDFPDPIVGAPSRCEDDALSKVMHSLKSFTANEINKALNRKGSVWDRQYYEHGIRNEKALMQTVRYCLENPVRKGLVEDFRNYPFWHCMYEV